MATVRRHSSRSSIPVSRSHCISAESTALFSSGQRGPGVRHDRRGAAPPNRETPGMCTTAQTRTAKAGTLLARQRDLPARREHMLLIIGLLLTVIAAALIYRARVPGGVNEAQLGWVSERWLAEHRASTRR